MIDKVRQISEENQQSHEREKLLQEELSSRLAKEKEVSADVEEFKKSLRELQVSPLNSDAQPAARRQAAEGPFFGPLWRLGQRTDKPAPQR